MTVFFLFLKTEKPALMAHPSTTLKLFAKMFYLKKFSLFTYRTKTTEPTRDCDCRFNSTGVIVTTVYILAMIIVRNFFNRVDAIWSHGRG